LKYYQNLEQRGIDLRGYRIETGGSHGSQVPLPGGWMCTEVVKGTRNKSKGFSILQELIVFVIYCESAIG